jgi:hypothetical protein
LPPPASCWARLQLQCTPRPRRILAGGAAIVRRASRVVPGADGTLVIDTIGLQARSGYIDHFRTPHTEKLHVVERFKLSADGRTLEAVIKVEDPDTFNEPLFMMRRWRKVPNPLVEMVCAENNEDHFGKNLFPVPQADKPDF